MFIDKFINKIFGEKRKFIPAVDKNGNFEVDKPLKFIPITEKEYLLIQRHNGVIGNGLCRQEDF